MAIKKIKVSNFKSFRNLEVELDKFNVLIGANAAGKSNFIQIFKLLRDIANHGLDNAISMQGGVEYIRNINIGASSNLSLEVIANQMSMPIMARSIRNTGIKLCETAYKFVIQFNKRGAGFNIVEDRLIAKCEFVRLEKEKRKTVEKESMGQGEISLSNIDGRIRPDLKPDDGPIKTDDIFPRFLKSLKLPPKTLLLQSHFFHLMPFIPMPPVENIFNSIAIYDFDPKLPKKAVSITGKAELEEDGCNLAIVLSKILKNRENKRKLSTLLRDVLPFIDRLNVDNYADKSLLFKLRETYSKKEYIPASLISDGTINITALIIALYFEKKLLSIFEEPERNIHPFLVSKVVNMLKDASENKQIIVTTHNPEVVKYAGLENILLMSRDNQGFSTIVRPSEKEDVKTFLENEIGVEELFVQNLIGV